jgi:hypothetical protein
MLIVLDPCSLTNVTLCRRFAYWEFSEMRGSTKALDDDFRGLAEAIRSRPKPQFWASRIGGVHLAETLGMPVAKYRAAFKHSMSEEVVIGIVKVAAFRATAI